MRDLTKDNPAQQNLCTRLEALTASRVALLRESIELKKSAPQDEARAGRDIPSRIADYCRNHFHDAADERCGAKTARRPRASIQPSVCPGGGCPDDHIYFSAHSFFPTLQLLTEELDAREQAEHSVRESEQSLRTLTARLLQLQDEERRRFSRELHDSLGQYLAAVKMNLDMFNNSQPGDRLLAEAIHLLDQSIAETRTISHLLHPPLLDEAGFSSAAKWYLDGFAQRSGIEVKSDFPDDVGRLPKSIELGLFRVLQESLTNIHRHSGSTKAEVELKLFPDRVILEVRDHGTGIPQALLRNFQDKGTNSGVGLAGMRERLRELGGRLDIRSRHGTLISVSHAAFANCQ